MSGGRRAIFGAAVACTAAATALLFVVSRGKWSDPLVDSGTEWIVPDTIARGGLLYRDHVYWFGPFPPQFQAAFFALFGSSFRTLALACAAGAVGVLAALYYALRAVVDRTHAAMWTAVAIPLLAFMPYSGGILIGMGTRMWYAAAFGLLAGALVCRSGGAVFDLGAGAAVGLAGLCRTEWGAAALAACVVALALRSPGGGRLALLRLLAGATIVFAGGLGFFVLRAGPDAVLRDAPVLLFNLPPETRAAVAAANPAEWGRGLVQMVYAASTWVAAFLGIEILVRRGQPGVARRRLVPLAVLVAVIAACGALAGAPSNVFLSAAPLLCAASILIAVRSGKGPLAAALGAFGTLGLLTSYRRPFFLADGPYVAPPILFALVCAAGCVTLAVERRPPEVRARLAAACLAAVGSLVALLFVLRGLTYRADDRVPIPGTGGMLSARPEVVRDIEAVRDRVVRQTAPGDALVVFPEGEVLNFLTGRRNPIRHKLYLPGYVSAENEPEILDELTKARPAAVVIWPRRLGEYGRDRFGVDYALSISSWIGREYRLENVGGAGRGPVVGIRRKS